MVQVRPSLLRGDLWSGNLSVVEGGQWAILDPACYYGQPALALLQASALCFAWMLLDAGIPIPLLQCLSLAT